MLWALAAAAGIIAAEILLRVPLARTLARVRDTVTKVLAVVGSSNISDHWKERAVPAYAGRLFGLTLATAFWLLLVLVPFVAAGLLAEFMDLEFAAFAISPAGLVFTTVVAAGYAGARIAVGRH